MATKATKKKSAPAKKAVSKKPAAKKAACKKPATKKAACKKSIAKKIEEVMPEVNELAHNLNGYGFVILRMDYDVGVKGFWRQIVAPLDFTLEELEAIIQGVFGWQSAHLYNFTKGDQCYLPEEIDVEYRDPEDKLATEVKVEDVLKKKGDKLTYIYDLGDENVVNITCLGTTNDIDLADFDTEGQDAVEDSAGFGFISGIVKLLTTEKDTPAARECCAWLKESLGKDPEVVLYVPTAELIYLRTVLLITNVLFGSTDEDEDED